MLHAVQSVSVRCSVRLPSRRFSRCCCVPASWPEDCRSGSPEDRLPVIRLCCIFLWAKTRRRWESRLLLATTWPAPGVMFDVSGLAPSDGYSVRNVVWLGTIAVTLTTTALTPVAGTPLPVTPAVMVRVVFGPSGPCGPEPLSH